MQVSDADSNKFCKFDEIWWIFRRCKKITIFRIASAVSIFAWKILMSLNGNKFYMQVSDADSYKLWKFDEISELWEDVKIS